MMVSAEARWFWPEDCPSAVREWFERGISKIRPGGADEDRIDQYFHVKGNTELGIKIRNKLTGQPPDVEVKGLVAVLSGDILPPTHETMERFIQLWCKWKAPGITGGRYITTRKRRLLRKFNVIQNTVEEMQVDNNENVVNGARPETGCNLELTRVTLNDSGSQWCTLGFEAFGTIETAQEAFDNTFLYLCATRVLSPVAGFFLSYPEWLDKF
jgi:hypothetical protein